MIQFCCVALTMMTLIAAPAASMQDGAPPSNQQSQDGAKNNRRDKTGELLGGPDVGDRDSAQPDSQFAGRTNNRSVAVPFNRWLRVIGALPLSLDQRAEVETIARAYQQDQRSFQTEHGKRLRELQLESRRLRREGRDVPRELQQNIQQVRRLVPVVAEYQERIWTVLTLDQADEARAELAAVREQIARRRQEQQERRRQMDTMRGAEDSMMNMMADPAADQPTGKLDRPEHFNWETPGLDAASMRRLAFLLRHQAAASQIRPLRD